MSFARPILGLAVALGLRSPMPSEMPELRDGVDLHGAAVARAVATLDWQAGVPWLPWSAANLEALEGQPVLVWVRADWDATSHMLARFVLPRPEVRACLQASGVAPVRLDATAPSEEARAWLAAQHAYAPSFVLIPAHHEGLGEGLGEGPGTFVEATLAQLVRAVERLTGRSCHVELTR